MSVWCLVLVGIDEIGRLMSYWNPVRGVELVSRAGVMCLIILYTYIYYKLYTILFSYSFPFLYSSSSVLSFSSDLSIPHLLFHSLPIPSILPFSSSSVQFSSFFTSILSSQSFSSSRSPKLTPHVLSEWMVEVCGL